MVPALMGDLPEIVPAKIGEDDRNFESVIFRLFTVEIGTNFWIELSQNID